MAGEAKSWAPRYFKEMFLGGWQEWPDLTVASFLGLRLVVEDILAKENFDVNARGGYYGTALQAASAEGHKEIVGMLLEKGARINARGGYYDSALQAATEGGFHLAPGKLSAARAEETPLTFVERPETPPPPSATIPFSRDPDFVERGDILDQIDKRCTEPAARVALVGLGGVGKSQLAIEYAHRIAAKQPDTWVFWVHAGTQARVEEGFRAIADTVKLPSRNQPKANLLQLVYGWLCNERNGRWVMVLDSADDRDVFYGPTSGEVRNDRSFATYLPQSRNGSIIITTRDKDLASRLTGRRQNMIEVGPMAQRDALTLLEKKLGSLPDTDVAPDLVQALDLVPLAVSQAAAYIQARAPRSSPEKYLADFRESERQRTRLLGHDAGDLRRDGGASNAMLATWQISFDHIVVVPVLDAFLESNNVYNTHGTPPVYEDHPERDPVSKLLFSKFAQHETTRIRPSSAS
ncbi:P-loop containing nucleoside triphosphate hydrolase protein [Coniochaeta sp. 2T2.1]|nr:P-loop containing nucleoside triphosphate hydrolase protein [Coniochaeta sp. 2T2.1]